MTRSATLWIVWHGLAAVVIALVPLRARFDLLWNLPPEALTFAVGASVTYLVVAAVVTAKAHFTGRVRFVDLVSIVGIGVAGLFLLVSLYRSAFHRSIVFPSVALVVALSLLWLMMKPRMRPWAVPVLAAAVLLSLMPGIRQPQPEQRIIRSNAYDLLARYYRQPFQRQEVTGGALSLFGDRYLLATGEGRIYSLRWNVPIQTLETRELPHRVPLNRDEFAAEPASDSFGIGTFRTADILVQESGDRFRLFASHHFWHLDRKCFTLRVSSTSGTHAGFLETGTAATWQTVFETQPCLPMKPRHSPFGGHQAGGRMQWIDERRLLLTVGDHERDGYWSDDMVSQDAQVSYGKTLVVDVETGAASVHTLGHRNPQGLYIDDAGNAWSTEHGPKGGDELNLLVEGRNYGWPFVTYGTEYEQRVWPLSDYPGRHVGFEPPAHAWVPSIGISNIAAVRGPLLDAWRNDLLVSSLANMSIWRVRLEQLRVATVERIEIGERIRDLIEDRDGRLILWIEGSYSTPTYGGVVVVEPLRQDDGPTAVLADQAARGELAFSQCVGCHTADGSDGRGLGPDLRGVARRRIASAGKYTYSDALSGMAGAWTDERLDSLLADPQRFAPGTSMQFVGIADSALRADLIAYLHTLR